MLKRSTLTSMRLAAFAAAAATIAAASAGCGKQPAAVSQPETRSARVPSEDEATPLAGKDGGAPKPKPSPDPCPACGMG